MMNARLNKALVALLAVAAVGACDDPPVEPGNSDPARIFTNPSFVTVDAGASRTVQAYLVNELGNPVLGDVDFTACNSVITAVEDPDQTDIEPGQNIIVTGNTLGTSCIELSGSGFERTIQVRVVPAEVSVAAVTDTVRAGATGSIDVVLLDANGEEVGPFVEQDAEFATSNDDALFFTDSVGGFDTHEAAGVIVTVTHESFGVDRTVTIPVTVLPAEPDTGYFEEDDFASALVGDTVSLQVFLEDTIGNINNYDPDIDDIEVTSGNTSVATAYVEITEDPDFEGRIVMTVYAVGVGEGATEISATANTVSGPIDLGSAGVTFLSEVDITSVLPSGAETGDLVTITGTGLSTGLAETTLIVGGHDATADITAITPTSITFAMHAPGEAGTIDITVDVGGATSETVEYEFGGETEEPANDDGVARTLPIDEAGFFGGTDIFDVFTFTSATTGDLALTLDWDTDKDLDIWVEDADGEIICESYTAHPEEATCPVVTGGDYTMVIMDWSNYADHDEATVRYQITLE